MIDLEQEVIIKWFTRNKKRFIDLGYKFTNLYDTFSVKVKHLERNSNVKVIVQCDDCVFNGYAADVFTKYYKAPVSL